jgi:hypothetical protein
MRRQNQGYCTTNVSAILCVWVPLEPVTLNVYVPGGVLVEDEVEPPPQPISKNIIIRTNAGAVIVRRRRKLSIIGMNSSTAKNIGDLGAISAVAAPVVETVATIFAELLLEKSTDAGCTEHDAFCGAPVHTN